MGQSIEEFVQKIRLDGVEAGREEAARIVEQARKEAAALVEEARVRAAAFTAEAEREARDRAEKIATELRLLCRDLLLGVRETLQAALQSMLARGADKALRDEEFLKGLIRDTVLAYAQKDAAGKGDFAVSLAPEQLARLAGAFEAELARAVRQGKIALRAGRAGAGYELQIGSGASLDVSAASVADSLMRMASPALAELLGVLKS